MNNEVIIVEQSFDVPSNQVWKALTDNGEMKKWYFDIDSFKPEVGFEFHFTAGDDKNKYLHLCKITEVIPGKKYRIHGAMMALKATAWLALSFLMKAARKG